MPGSELIQLDPSEAVEKLRLTLRVLGAFKNYYFEYRAVSATDTPDNPWKFQVSSWELKVVGRQVVGGSACASALITVFGTCQKRVD